MADDWEEIRTFGSEPLAHALAGMLNGEGVPAKVISRSDIPGLVQSVAVVVPASLAHRARWILAQETLSDAELDFAATGDLPGPEQH